MEFVHSQKRDKQRTVSKSLFVRRRTPLLPRCRARVHFQSTEMFYIHGADWQTNNFGKRGRKVERETDPRGVWSAVSAVALGVDEGSGRSVSARQIWSETVRVKRGEETGQRNRKCADRCRQRTWGLGSDNGPRRFSTSNRLSGSVPP